MTPIDGAVRRLAARLRRSRPVTWLDDLLRRVPIRARLTLAFASLMVVLFGGLALLLYTRFEAGLDAGINGELRGRAAAVGSVVGSPSGRIRRPLRLGGGASAQILAPGGSVVESTPDLRGQVLLRGSDLARARHETVMISREGYRLLARPVRHGSLIEVVWVSSAERDHALGTLGELLFIGGPVLLVLTCAAGYALASSALTPVERMRRKAARISRAGPSARLPVPEARDEIRRLGETLNDMLARLEEGVARERAFVADAGHELRTPLSILRLELELTLAEGSSREELAGGLRSAAEEADRLAKLADELLFIARADQGRLPIAKQRVEVAGVMRAIAGRVERRTRAAGRELRVEATDGLAVDADPHRLEQALTNMVENALRYGSGPVAMSAAFDNGTIELHVCDEGPGFPDGFLPRAFERFSRADSARSRGGTGLGLAIVQAIAEAHGGYVGAANRSGGGADVWLSLPRDAEQA
jgi:two-component system, OmpR family, sensor kinase